MALLRVLIADDHLLFRDGLRALLQADPEMEVAGEATNGAEVIALANECQPDVILMDIQMPKINGIEATRQIVQSHPHVKVMMLTMFEEDKSVFAAMCAGARGYVLKGVDHEEMLRAVRAIGNGEAIFSPDIAARMMDYFASMHSVSKPAAFPELSEREHEVLDLIAQGHKNAAIADQLVLSPKTVRNYVTSILAKLQVADRAQAIIRAREAGMGQE